jgi:hypothetical protein
VHAVNVIPMSLTCATAIRNRATCWDVWPFCLVFGPPWVPRLLSFLPSRVGILFHVRPPPLPSTFCLALYLPVILSFITVSQEQGRGSLVGIAARYGLHGPVIETRGGGEFSAPIENGPGAHPASCTLGTGSLSRRQSGRGVTLTYPV